MFIKDYREIKKSDWDNFVYSSTWGHTFLSYEYTCLPPPRPLKKKQYKNCSFAILNEKNELMLVCQIFVWSKRYNFWPIRKKISMKSFHGICVKDNLSKKEYQHLYEIFINHINSFRKHCKCNSFIISEPPFSDLLRPENVTLINPLIYWGFAPLSGYTYFIDLEQSLEIIQSQYVPTTRNVVSKIRSGTDVDFYESDGNEEDFYNLCHLNDICYENQSKDKKLTDEYLSELWKLIKRKEHIRCFFARQNKTVCSYVILSYYKDTVYYFWGAGVHNSSNIQRWLLHSLIVQSKQENFKYFEVGAANFWVSNKKDKNIGNFKKSFTHNLHPIYKGDFSFTK